MSGAVTRADFIKNLAKVPGMSYVQAGTAYDSFIKTIEDGICSGDKIQLSRVGAIVPVKLDPRPVSMGFRRGEGNTIEHVSRTYFLGTRIKYKFKLFKRFVESHTLDWKMD